MKATFSRTVAGWLRCGRPLRWPRAALLVVALGAIAYGGQIQIFRDDFQNYGPGENPGVPPVGQPWQITEVVPGGIDVGAAHWLQFGAYRNTALAPFSAESRQLIALQRNLTVRFDYFGFTGEPGYSHYFDIGGYDPASGDPAFLLRFQPEGSGASGRLHDVYYLDPAGGLADSGVDILADSIRAVTITADFANATYQLDVEGSSASLSMFTCPEEIVGVDFANYGVAMGSGSIDNLIVTVIEEEPGSSTPEHGTIVMLTAAAITAVLVGLLGLKADRSDGKAEADSSGEHGQ